MKYSDKNMHFCESSLYQPKQNGRHGQRKSDKCNKENSNIRVSIKEKSDKSNKENSDISNKGRSDKKSDKRNGKSNNSTKERSKNSTKENSPNYRPNHSPNYSNKQNSNYSNEEIRKTARKLVKNASTPTQEIKTPNNARNEYARKVNPKGKSDNSNEENSNYSSVENSNYSNRENSNNTNEEKRKTTKKWIKKIRTSTQETRTPNTAKNVYARNLNQKTTTPKYNTGNKNLQKVTLQTTKADKNEATTNSQPESKAVRTGKGESTTKNRKVTFNKKAKVR